MADSLDRDELPDDGYHRGNRLGHGVPPLSPPPSSLCPPVFDRLIVTKV